MAKTNSKAVNVACDIGNITSIGMSNEKEIVIESRIKKVESNIDDFSQNEKFTYENDNYLINEGKFENDILKFKKDNYLMLLYYTIAKCTDSNNINLVTCIPASRYKSRKEEMEEFIKQNNKKTVIVEGKKRNITIDKVTVLPEGYAFKSDRNIINNIKRNVDTTFLDFGGLTTDIVEFDSNMQLKNANSINIGLLTLYNSCREYINITYDLDLSLEECKTIFDGEQQLLVDAEFKYKKELVKKFIINIVNEIKAICPNLKNSNIFIFGGGSVVMENVMKQLYPQSITINDIKLQTKCLLNVANKIYG